MSDCVGDHITGKGQSITWTVSAADATWGKEHCTASCVQMYIVQQPQKRSKEHTGQ